jgi:nucleotide-binding universal stress UspA family protein
MFKNILVPTDGSQQSENAVRRVVSFAKEAGARVTAFHVKPIFSSSTLVGDAALSDSLASEQYKTPDEFDVLAEERAQKILGFVDNLCKETGVPCNKASKSHDVIYEAIIEAAKENGCDLIFMASHGCKGIKCLLLGSETNKVLTHSTIPVLVYR